LKLKSNEALSNYAFIFHLRRFGPVPIMLGDGSSGGAGAGGEGGDPEAVSQQQARLWSLAPRTASLSVGRGWGLASSA
jgi:hypothetical protein